MSDFLYQKPLLGTPLDLSNPINQGLVGCWMFNEAGGMKAYDLSGKNNHGSLIYFAFPSTSASGWHPGRTGSTLSFDGADDYVVIAHNPTLNVYSITMEAWVYRNTSTVDERMIVNKESSYEMQIGNISNSGQDHFEIAIKPNWVWKNGGFVPLEEWTHVAVTWDQNILRTYINGENTYSYDLTNGPVSDTTNILKIGARTESSAYFKGLIDEVRIYNRALSAQEISQLYLTPYAGLSAVSLVYNKIEQITTSFIQQIMQHKFIPPFLGVL